MIRRYTCVAATCISLYTCPVSAQTVVFDASMTERCLGNAQDGASATACIGRALDICLSISERGNAPLETAACIDAELVFWDAMLNTQYARIRSESVDVDAELASRDNGTVPVVDAVRDMQRAWIAYRDATCTFEMAQWGKGAGASPAYLACVMRMTGQQALTLSDISLFY